MDPAKYSPSCFWLGFVGFLFFTPIDHYWLTIESKLLLLGPDSSETLAELRSKDACGDAAIGLDLDQYRPIHA